MIATSQKTVTARQTKYTSAIVEALALLKHATAGQILGIVQQMYPEASETTIRRAADRLVARGVIASAPKTVDGCERYDITTTPHHHFMCQECSHLCNIIDNSQVQQSVELLKSLNKHCRIAGSITLQGVCHGCSKISGSEA